MTKLHDALFTTDGAPVALARFRGTTLADAFGDTPAFGLYFYDAQALKLAPVEPLTRYAGFARPRHDGPFLTFSDHVGQFVQMILKTWQWRGQRGDASGEAHWSPQSGGLHIPGAHAFIGDLRLTYEWHTENLGLVLEGQLSRRDQNEDATKDLGPIRIELTFARATLAVLKDLGISGITKITGRDLRPTPGVLDIRNCHALSRNIFGVPSRAGVQLAKGDEPFAPEPSEDDPGRTFACHRDERGAKPIHFEEMRFTQHDEGWLTYAGGRSPLEFKGVYPKNLSVDGLSESLKGATSFRVDVPPVPGDPEALGMVRLCTPGFGDEVETNWKHIVRYTVKGRLTLSGLEMTLNGDLSETLPIRVQETVGELEPCCFRFEVLIPWATLIVMGVKVDQHLEAFITDIGKAKTLMPDTPRFGKRG